MTNRIKKKEPEPCPARATAAPAALDVTPVAGHQFGAGLIALFVDLVLKAATSQRAAAAVLKLITPYVPGVLRMPCANAGRLWLMRLGLFELLRKKEVAKDWVWIMDHTVQLGPHKCLVIVGVRLSAWRRKKAPLEHEDLSLLNLVPMEQSNAVAVAEQLEATREAMGVVPVAVLSDEGAELKSGMALFREQSPGARRVPHVFDIKHKVALLLKRELEDDATWQSFVTRTNRAKLQTTLTELAFLVPPSLRTKARYMNLDTLVDWGTRVLAYLDDPRDLPGQTIDRAKLQQKLGWLGEYRSALPAWAELLAIAKRAVSYIRKNGYHHRAAKELKRGLLRLAHTPGGSRMQAGILEFVKEQSRSVKKRQHVLGSSEVLESLLGKYKRIQGTHSKGGMTGSLLNLGAAVMRKTSETIKQALAAVPVAAVGQWVRENLGLTVPAQQALAFQGNKKCPQNHELPLPSF
jgi:hypothetical protein